MMPDRELLRRYACEGDEAAFAEVVRRQADLVYSAALRLVRDAQLAQDVTQTVFIKLAARAGILARYDTVVGWLHATTRHCAVDAIRGEERRRAREREAFTMHDPAPLSETNWESIGPLLDEAVGSLDEADRKAVLLRYFKNFSHQEIGAELGLSENSANKRVERALDKLRLHFAGRGVTMSAALLGSAIGANAVRAAPAGLAAEVTTTSLAGAGGNSAFLTSFILMSTKTKIVLALVLVLIAAILLLHSRSAPVEAAAASKLPTVLTPPAALPAAIEAPSAAAVEPVRPAPAVVPVAVETPPAPVVNPQADIATAIPEFLRVAEAKDLAGIMRFMLTPQEIQADFAMHNITNEQALAEYLFQQQKDPAAQMADLAQMAHALQKATPVLTQEGARATFDLVPPVGKHTRVVFVKKDGLWYLRSS